MEQRYSYLLTIEGLGGDIAVESFSWGQEAACTGGKAAMQNFEFVAPVGRATPRLLAACAAGEHFQRAVLMCLRSEVAVLRLVFSSVLIASHKIEGAAPQPPKDRAALLYAQLECEYRELLPDGSLSAPVRGGWDLAANQAVQD